MALSADNARVAIIELLEGTTTSIRDVTDNAFGDGFFAGQPDGATRAQAIHTYTHRFGAEMNAAGRHRQGPGGAMGNQRLVRARIHIPIATHTKTTVQESARDTTLAAIASDADEVMQALGYPGNLDETAASNATGIVGGCLGDLRWELDAAEWGANLIKSHIEGTCVFDSTLLLVIRGTPGEWQFNDTANSSHILTSIF